MLLQLEVGEEAEHVVVQPDTYDTYDALVHVLVLLGHGIGAVTLEAGPEAARGAGLACFRLGAEALHPRVGGKAAKRDELEQFVHVFGVDPGCLEDL